MLTKKQPKYSINLKAVSKPPTFNGVTTKKFTISNGKKRRQLNSRTFD